MDTKKLIWDQTDKEFLNKGNNSKFEELVTELTSPSPLEKNDEGASNE